MRARYTGDKVTRNVAGALVYDGKYPVRMLAGQPQVFGTYGWLDVVAFETSNLTTEELETAYAVIELVPEGQLGKAYRGEAA